jgi:hypothetical protein
MRQSADWCGTITVASTGMACLVKKYLAGKIFVWLVERDKTL